MSTAGAGLELTVKALNCSGTARQACAPGSLLAHVARPQGSMLGTRTSGHCPKRPAHFRSPEQSHLRGVTVGGGVGRAPDHNWGLWP